MVNKYVVVDNNRVVNIAVADEEFATKNRWLPFTPEAQIGFAYDGKKFFADEVYISSVANQVRATRDDILAKYVDPIVLNPLRWNDLTQEQKDALSQYRKDLLDIPEQEGFPLNVAWPTFPL